jgi:hypothetical protein
MQWIALRATDDAGISLIHDVPPLFMGHGQLIDNGVLFDYIL